MKRLCLLLAGVSLLVPAGAFAQGPPPGRGGPPANAARAVAGVLCLAELKQLGQDAFRAKYTSPGSCLDAHADQAAQILDTCKSAADPRACLRDALGLPAGPHTPARPRPVGPRGRMLPLVPLVAGALCHAELKSTSVDAFKAKYKTRGACLQANAAKAAGIVKDAQTQCASAERKGPCLLQALARALGLPARGPRK